MLPFDAANPHPAEASCQRLHRAIFVFPCLCFGVRRTLLVRGNLISHSNFKVHISEKAKRRDSFWAVAPNLNVVTVLTPATTWMEGFTNHLVVLTISRALADSNRSSLLILKCD